MMGTKADPGKYDCYAIAEDDEPMFVLLARDATSSGVVREWASMKMQVKGYDHAKIGEALECADAMDAWRREKERVSLVDVAAQAAHEVLVARWSADPVAWVDLGEEDKEAVRASVEAALEVLGRNG